MEKKSSNGDTPLLVAARIGRTDIVKILVAGNADQSARNNKGENILHMALAGGPAPHQLRPLLESLDPELRSHLLKQPMHLAEGGTAPLQAWVAMLCQGYNGMTTRQRPRYKGREKEVLDMMQLLLGYLDPESSGLDMLSGAGDTCLHMAVVHQKLAIIKALIDYEPRLLYRENAVGRTPAEVAYDTLTSSRMARPKHSSWVYKGGEFMTDLKVKSLTPGDIKAKLDELGLSGDYSTEEVTAIYGSAGLAGNHTYFQPGRRADHALRKRVIWDLCHSAMRKHPGVRRLVSLNEANDVARRLGEQQASSRYFTVRARRDEYEDEDEDEDGEDGDKKSPNEDILAQELFQRIGWPPDRTWPADKEEP